MVRSLDEVYAFDKRTDYGLRATRYDAYFLVNPKGADRWPVPES